MVCCWISLITTSGIPIAQFASDGLPVPFSVQGVLAALQTNAAVGQATIQLIETELADIAYQLTAEIMLVCTMGRPFQRLASVMVNNVKSCLELLDCLRNEHITKQLVKDIKMAAPVFSKLLQDSKYRLHWIGLPLCRLHQADSFLEDLISITRCFSETDCAAISLRDGSIVRMSSGWSNLPAHDAWSIIMLGLCAGSDSYYEYGIKIGKLVVINHLHYIVFIVVSAGDSETSLISAALNQFKEAELVMKPIAGGLGIEGYFLRTSSSASIWFRDDEEDLSRILMGEYCSFLDIKREGDCRHMGQYTIAKNWSLYWHNDDGFDMLVVFSKEVPMSCFSHVAKGLLERLTPFLYAIQQ